MTRSEFDQQVRELKNKRGDAIREIATLQSEIKEEIAAKHRQINDIHKEISKLQTSLQGYHQRRIALETEWNAKVNAFIKENAPSLCQTSWGFSISLGTPGQVFGMYTLKMGSSVYSTRSSSPLSAADTIALVYESFILGTSPAEPPHQPVLTRNTFAPLSSSFFPSIVA